MTGVPYLDLARAAAADEPELSAAVLAAVPEKSGPSEWSGEQSSLREPLTVVSRTPPPAAWWMGTLLAIGGAA